MTVHHRDEDEGRMSKPGAAKPVPRRPSTDGMAQPSISRRGMLRARTPLLAFLPLRFPTDAERTMYHEDIHAVLHAFPSTMWRRGVALDTRRRLCAATAQRQADQATARHGVAGTPRGVDYRRRSRRAAATHLVCRRAAGDRTIKHSTRALDMVPGAWVVRLPRGAPPTW